MRYRISFEIEQTANEANHAAEHKLTPLEWFLDAYDLTHLVEEGQIMNPKAEEVK